MAPHMLGAWVRSGKDLQCFLLVKALVHLEEKHDRERSGDTQEVQLQVACSEFFSRIYYLAFRVRSTLLLT